MNGPYQLPSESPAHQPARALLGLIERMAPNHPHIAWTVIRKRLNPAPNTGPALSFAVFRLAVDVLAPTPAEIPAEAVPTRKRREELQTYLTELVDHEDRHDACLSLYLLLSEGIATGPAEIAWMASLLPPLDLTAPPLVADTAELLS